MTRWPSWSAVVAMSFAATGISFQSATAWTSSPCPVPTIDVLATLDEDESIVAGSKPNDNPLMHTAGWLPVSVKTDIEIMTQRECKGSQCSICVRHVEVQSHREVGPVNMSRDYPHWSRCKAYAVIRHERIHAANQRRAHARVRSEVTAAVRRALNRFPATGEAADAEIARAAANDAVKSAMNRIADDTRRLDQTIDTPEAYEAAFAHCD